MRKKYFVIQKKMFTLSFLVHNYNQVREMTINEQDRERRQQKLADLFFEMGMDLDLIEKVSGVDKRKIILKSKALKKQFYII